MRSEERPLKRAKRGRPRKGAAAPTETVWIVSAAVELDDAVVVSERQHACCFPLMTDHLDTPGWDDARILSEYRHQGLVEGVTGFRWLKGPGAIAPMFLKTPTRMRALGVVLVLALMVRNDWQFRMRSAARAAAETIMHPFTKRLVTNLTAEMAMEHFGGMQAVRICKDEVWSRIPRVVSETGLQILRYLGVPASVFWTPPREKMTILRI